MTTQELTTSEAPTVSVIMPAYGVAKYISAALDSIFAQTFQDYEIIVVNDGSLDTTELELAIAPYRDRIVYIEQENRGCSAARNAAIRVARGRYIALLDADDLWQPDYLAIQIERLENDRSIDVIYPNALIFGDSPKSGKLFMELLPSDGEVTLEKLISQRCNVMISVTARREAIVRAGLFDENLRSSEDFDMWLRILLQGGRICYHRRVLVHYRQRRESLSANPVSMCQHILRVFEGVQQRNHLTPAQQESLQRAKDHFSALLNLCEGKRAFFDGDTDRAIEKLTEANRFFRRTKIQLALLLLRAAPQFALWVYDLRDRFVVGMSTRF